MFRLKSVSDHQKYLIYSIFLTISCLFLVYLWYASIPLLLCFIVLYQEFKKEKGVHNSLLESPIEEIFWQAARKRISGLIPQYKVGRFRSDFAVPFKKVLIECDGRDYHSKLDHIISDLIREFYLKSKGWNIIRFSGGEIYNNVNKCVLEALKKIEY